MRRTLTLLVMSLVLAVMGVGPCLAEVSIGNVILGKTLEECGLKRCSGSRFAGDCIPVLIIGEEGIVKMNLDLSFWTETYVFYGESERIYYIEVSFHPLDFDRMLVLCKGNLREPSSHSSSTIQDSMGAEYKQEEVSWTVEENTIFLVKYDSGRVDQGRLSLYTPEALKTFSQRE